MIFLVLRKDRNQLNLIMGIWVDVEVILHMNQRSFSNFMNTKTINFINGFMKIRKTLKIKKDRI